MAGVVEEIFRIKSDTAQVLKQIQDLKGVFVELTEEQKQQVQQLTILEQKEKALLKARTQSSNPTTLIKINKEYNETIKKLGALKESVDSFTKSEIKAKEEANLLSQAVSNAFKQTQVAGAGKAIDDLAAKASGATKNGFNPLNNSVNQLTRELPAFAVSANVGFLAISNNLPIFFDAIERTKKVNAELKNSGQETQSVLKQLGGAVFSLGSLLSIGVTLLTLYGGEIIKWTAALFDSEKALESTKTANDEFNKSINKTKEDIADLTIQLKVRAGILSKTEGDLLKNENERRKRLKENDALRAKSIKELRKELGITNELLALEGKKRTIILEGQREETDILSSAEKTKIARYREELKRLQELSALDRKAINEYYNLRGKLAKEEGEGTNRFRARLLEEELIKQRSVINEIRKMQIESITDAKERETELAVFQTQLAFDEIERNNETEREKLRIAEFNYKQRVAIEKQNVKDKKQLVENLKDLESKYDREVAKIKADNIPEAEQAQLREALAEKLAKDLLEIEKKYGEDARKLAVEDLKKTYQARADLIQENISFEIFLEERKLANMGRVNGIGNTKALRAQRLLIIEKKKALIDANAEELLQTETNYAKRQLIIKKAENEKKKLDIQAEEEEKARNRRRLQNNIQYLADLLKAVIDATRQILAIEIKKVDDLIQQQQRRVDAVRNIADKGNAELLQLEQERLDDLTKKKEKFVRDQQALAAVELIANTAIAVSKAAAQGGVAAGVTIAAALIALVAGLASARAIAGQAAFYDGGLYDEKGGYTGDGNPTHESKAFRKPYIHHKQEVIISHKPTRKFKDILLDVNDGKIDLNEWKNKVNMYDAVFSGKQPFNLTGQYMNQPQVTNIIQFKQMEAKMDEMNRTLGALKLGLNVDEDGFTTFMQKRIERKNFIKNLAK